MSQPVCIQADIRHTHERSHRPMKSLSRNQILDRSRAAIHSQSEIQHLFPHRRQETQMPLLPGVLLCDLEFDALVSLLQSAKKRRYRFPCLKINGTILDPVSYTHLTLPTSD